MCGICGYIRKKSLTEDKLNEMNDSMIHRGPNDHGLWMYQDRDRAIGIAQRRLSILDLSAAGHQPMLSHSGNSIISYNGEVYNFLELKNELKALGYSFSSECDTEVILASYEEWGEECFNKFNGMFAISIYDIVRHRLILARDKIGKKPLYYYYKDSEVVFGSELKPIMLCPELDLEIDVNAVGKLLSNKYIESPFTIYTNVYKVEPGEYIVFSENKIAKKKYWNLVDIYNASRNFEKISSLEEAKRQLGEILDDAVEKRMIADVPLGTFLSGGIDSTLVTALTQKNSSKPIDTFTIGFNDKDRNEAPEAAAIAKHLGTNHHEYYVGEDELKAMIKDLPLYYDEPFADSSQIPSMLVSEIAAKEITVALTGDGGDEFFCGYKMYDLAWIAQKLDFLGAIESKMPWDTSLKKSAGPEIRAFINNRGINVGTQSQLFTDVRIEEANKLLGSDVTGARYDIEKSIFEKDWQKRRMILDMVTYLPDEVLQKMDRASMRSSLEVRAPLLDYRIAEWSFRVDHSLKYHNFDKKYLLKQLTYDYVPKELLDGPKKGFGVPMAKWLRTYLKDDIQEFASESYLKKQGIFDPMAVKNLIETQGKSDKVMYSSVLWSWYVFQRWYEQYVGKNV